MRESFALYDVRVSPQFVPAELLADTGALGFGTAVLLVASIFFALLRSGDYAAVSAAAGLLVADGFQANWRWPMLFIAIAVLLVVSASRTPGERAIREAPG
jgi:hypothetical protein